MAVEPAGGAIGQGGSEIESNEEEALDPGMKYAKCMAFGVLYSAWLVINTTTLYHGGGCSFRIEPLDIHPANFITALANYHCNQLFFLLVMLLFLVASS